MASQTIQIVQSKWLEEIIADPISKTKLTRHNNNYESETGFTYSIHENIPDFRILLNHFSSEWQKGQDSYESRMIKYLDRAENDFNYYLDEQKRDAPMYERLPLEGRVLDVGGNLGAIRKYMQETQEFCSVDPFTTVCRLAEGKTNLFKHYPMHLPLNFVAGFAEFLPFTSSSYNTINMRSCIDHFFNPELALLEANRVLKPNGKLIIGMSVEVSGVSSTAKKNILKILKTFTKKFEDTHMWHPTKADLVKMCEKCGFEPEDEIWQSSNVWYASFRKKTGTLVKIT